MNKITIVAILSLVLFSFCSPKTNNEKEKQFLMRVDKAFSNCSMRIGIHKAFLQNIDSACVLLRTNHKPIVGHNAIETLFKKGDDSAYIMVWTPLSAEIAVSGDMGFTYGTYELSSKKDKTVKEKGTYVSIWKKTKDGEWKLWLDTGNEGLGE